MTWFNPAGVYDHPLRVNESGYGVEVGIGGRRAMRTRLSLSETRRLAQHLLEVVDRLERGPEIRPVPITLGAPP